RPLVDRLEPGELIPNGPFSFYGASRTILLLGRPDGKGGHEIGSKSASRWDWDPRTGCRRAELGLPKGNADISPTPTWTRIRRQTPRACAPGRRAAKRRPGQPRVHTAIGDARSRGEGGREHSRVKEVKRPRALPSQPGGF
ncbi:LHX1 isoform 5, partial [Pan troglodytes]